MSTKTALIPSHNFNSDHFSFELYHSSQTTAIEMKVLEEKVNTASLPETYAILEKLLPSILKCQCINDKGLPFREELKKTEFGHLFEHILLEYLCELKFAQGYREVEYSGFTDWNWKHEQVGTFHITIQSGLEDKEIMKEALKRTVDLVNIIFATHTNSHEAMHYSSFIN